MKKKLIFILLFSLLLCTIGCNNTNNVSEPVNLENTYWVSDEYKTGYYFEKDVLKLITFGEESEYQYSIENNTINYNNKKIPFTINEDILTIENGVSMTLKKSNKDLYENLKNNVDKDPADTTPVVTPTEVPSSDERGDGPTLPDNTETPTPTVTPDIEPTQTPVEFINVLENTYWYSNEHHTAYYFQKNVLNYVVFGQENSNKYTITEDTITCDGETASYKIENDLLYVHNGFVVVYQKVDKQTYEDLIFNVPELELTDSDYIGMTIREFVETGAEITGYMGVSKEYRFSGYNLDKSEKYTFLLEEENLKEALDKKDFDNEYVDVIGNFKIVSMEVRKLDNELLKKYIGNTLEEYLKDGFYINGFTFFGNLTLFGFDENGNSMNIQMESATKEIYETIEDPFNADMEEIFKSYKIENIEYNLMW